MSQLETLITVAAILIVIYLGGNMLTYWQQVG
jgi:hypothetical protein